MRKSKRFMGSVAMATNADFLMNVNFTAAESFDVPVPDTFYMLFIRVLRSRPLAETSMEIG